MADRESREADPRRTAAIRAAAFERGVVVGVGGHADHVLKLCPPLTIDERILDLAVEVTVDAIKGSR